MLMIAAAISGGWYLARKGFRGQWRARMVEELHRRGVEASIGHLTLDPFRGLVARNVRIFSYKERSETLAFISEIALDINYAAFFHHQPFLNALDIRNAELTLPLKGPGGKKVERPQLRKFHAHIYFPPEQIHISQAEGIFAGCDYGVSDSGPDRAAVHGPQLPGYGYISCAGCDRGRLPGGCRGI